jgi:hypothetical protein
MHDGNPGGADLPSVTDCESLVALGQHRGRAAAIVLCVPFYFVSVWPEILVAHRFLPEFERVQVKGWSRVANAVSYRLIVFGLFGYMLYLLSR